MVKLQLKNLKRSVPKMKTLLWRRGLDSRLYQQKLDVSSLNNGVYFVRFEMDGVLVGTEKLVIAR